MSIFLKNKLNKIVDEIVGEFQNENMDERFLYNIVIGKLRNGNEEVNKEDIEYVMKNVTEKNNKINSSKKLIKSERSQANSFFYRSNKVVPMGGRKSKLRRKKRANKKTIKRRRKKCV